MAKFIYSFSKVFGMGSFTERKDVKKALAEAKRLADEPEPVPTREQEVALQKEMVSLSEKLKSLLESEWFVKDVCTPKKKGGKKAGAGKKKKK